MMIEECHTTDFIYCSEIVYTFLHFKHIIYVIYLFIYTFKLPIYL